MEIYWRCIGDMLDAKIRIFFESSKENIRNFCLICYMKDLLREIATPQYAQ